VRALKFSYDNYNDLVTESYRSAFQFHREYDQDRLTLEAFGHIFDNDIKLLSKHT
jgi:hypothetical protein